MKDLERNDIMFGAAYYPEYMPYERLQEDIAMMQEAGMNTVRIAESTWSTLEPVEGKFDFSYIDKVLAAVEKAGMYAVRACIFTTSMEKNIWILQQVLQYSRQKHWLRSTGPLLGSHL